MIRAETTLKRGLQEYLLHRAGVVELGMASTVRNAAQLRRRANVTLLDGGLNAMGTWIGGHAA